MKTAADRLRAIEGDVFADWRSKSKSAIHKTDPEAWLWDVLRLKWHKKQREFVWAFVENKRTAIKSANGTGKSRGFGELISWGVATHEPGELLCIATAPTLRQIDEVLFAYLNANYSRAKAMNHPFIGAINDSLHWNYRETPRSPAKTLVLGQKPGDRDIVSTFQGIRAVSLDQNTKTWVFIDEGGGVHPDLFVAAESVTTGDGKIGVIGNPDNLGTYFHKIFTDDRIGADWSKHTISGFDLPTMTGEIVYDDPELQERMLTSGMQDREWIEQKKNAWGEGSARYQSKVLGEFPDSDDRSFFSQTSINKANDTVIVEDNEVHKRGGLDLARFGEDSSTLYTNQGGRIRRLDEWSKATANESATKAHTLCLEHGITALVVDAAGLGGPIVDQIAARAEGRYAVFATLGAERSPDPTRWANARAYWYDMLREAMMAGKIDLDLFEDKQLHEELLNLQFDFTLRGALKIESKKDMAARGVKSPDRLDAVVYSFIDAVVAMSGTNALPPGSTALFDPWEMLDMGDRAGLPL